MLLLIGPSPDNAQWCTGPIMLSSIRTEKNPLRSENSVHRKRNRGIIRGSNRLLRVRIHQEPLHRVTRIRGVLLLQESARLLKIPIGAVTINVENRIGKIQKCNGFELEES